LTNSKQGNQMMTPQQPTVSDAFELLAKSTELSLNEYTSITHSQADIERHLMQELGTISSVLFGAFSRRTIVSPLQDSIVDMLVLFRGAEIGRLLPSRVFSELKGALLKQYPQAYALDNRSVMMLAMNNFYFKIQPAYPVSGHVYMLPDENFNEWAKYDITSYNDIFMKQNVRHKGKLIDVVRMIKTWNRVSGNIFNGYYLELLVTELLSSYEMSEYSHTLRTIFRSAVAEVVFQKHDPANMDIQVEGLNDIDDLIKAMKLLQKSFSLADEAILHEQDGDTKKALECWNQLFPRVFPRQLDMMVGKARSSGIKGAEALKMIVDNQ
jgi:Second Messenger Oligonucleotide or Dinucleotide Synthetase domain